MPTTTPEVSPLWLPTALTAQLEPRELSALIERYLLEKEGYAARGVSYGGLTSQIRPPTVAPAVVRFRDQATGRWMHGVSEPKIDLNHFRIDLLVQAYDPCGVKAHWHRKGGCSCKKQLCGVREGPANLLVNNFARLVTVGLFGQTTSINDTGNTPRSVTAVVLGGGMTSKLGHAGTGVTAATVADVNMQTSTETAALTVNAVSGAGPTGTMTITFTVTAAAPRQYTEVGMVVLTVTSAWSFLLAHDSFAALSVSTSGTLAVTYNVTNQ